MLQSISDSFVSKLPGDPDTSNDIRQVSGACYSMVTPTAPGAPFLIAASEEAAALVGISKENLKSKEFLDYFSGSAIPSEAKPFAMCYGGHQFGQWAGQLGDGRAINLTEVMHDDKRWTLQLKGAGKTPYSRSADGLAVLRSSIREFLCSEAMYHLGAPTTRALSLIGTGDQVWRDMFYDGRGAYEPGAVVCRIAPTFIRFGNFQIHAARREHQILKQLTDYTIQNFFPHFNIYDQDVYFNFFNEVSERTLKMILHWQSIGFVHGVMNTDNMSILGLTIDYGPYGWMDDYNPGWTPNTTDASSKRYTFENQPAIAQWNLIQLANAFYPLMPDADRLKEMLQNFQKNYQREFLRMSLNKLGIFSEKATYRDLTDRLDHVFLLHPTDMTIFYRLLSNFTLTTASTSLKEQALSILTKSWYNPDKTSPAHIEKWLAWFEDYRLVLMQEGLSDSDRKKAMDRINPKYVIRNYMAQMAIEKAHDADYSIIHELMECLQHPYEEQPNMEHWFARRPEWAIDKPGCSTLSCSS